MLRYLTQGFIIIDIFGDNEFNGTSYQALFLCKQPDIFATEENMYLPLRDL